MKVKKITKEFLRKHDACKNGYKWFVRNFPNGLLINYKNMVTLSQKLLSTKAWLYELPNTNIEQPYDTLNQLSWLLSIQGCRSSFTNYEYVYPSLSAEKIAKLFMKHYAKLK